MSYLRVPYLLCRTLATAGAAAALLVALGGCGGGAKLEAHPTRTVSSSHPYLKVSRVVGSRRTPQQEAAFAEERTKNPGPASDLEPLHRGNFVGPVSRYRVYSEHQAKAVQRYVTRLQGDLRVGDVAAAKDDELAAYDHYLRLGAAYGVLGKLDEEIDGNPGRLPGGTHSPEFTGLHRIEMGLWEGEAPARLIAPARYLAAKVKRLQVAVRRIPISPSSTRPAPTRSSRTPSATC